MEAGFLQGNQRIAWVYKKHPISLLPGKGEILLENHAVSSFMLPALVCKACKKIVIDYTKKDVREG